MFLRELGRDFDAVLAERFDQHGAGEGGGVGNFADADDVRFVGWNFARDADVAVAGMSNGDFQRLIFLDGVYVELDFEQRGVWTPGGFGRLAGLGWIEGEIE